MSRKNSSVDVDSRKSSKLSSVSLSTTTNKIEIYDSDDNNNFDDDDDENRSTIIKPLSFCFDCFRWRRRRSKRLHEPDIVKILLIGLDNAGKTTLALHLAGESVDDVVSTIGFSKYELRLPGNRFQIVLYDVGGGKRIRGIWKNYYSLVHGIIFVIDSADLPRILEVKELIDGLVSNVAISGKPILIYLNKQDIREAMDEIDLCKFTNMEETMSKYQCPMKIVPISARNTTININATDNRTEIDPAIEMGLRWLLDYIDDNWTILKERVEETSKQQIDREHDTMRQRINNIQNAKLIEIESKVPITPPKSPEIDTNLDKPEIESNNSRPSTTSDQRPPLLRGNRIHPTH